MNGKLMDGLVHKSVVDALEAYWVNHGFATKRYPSGKVGAWAEYDLLVVFDTKENLHKGEAGR